MQVLEDKKIEKLKSLIEMINESITREEFLKSFQNIIDLVLKIEKKNNDDVDSIKNLYSETIKKIREDNVLIINSTVKGLKNKFTEKINDFFLKLEINQKISSVLKELKKRIEDYDNKVILIDEKLKNIRDGKDPIKGIDYFDGKDADEEKIIQNILGQIQIPVVEKENIDEKIEGKLNPIIEEFRKNWEDKVQQVLGRRGMRGLGGMSVIVPRPLKGISTDTTPAITGAINGTNKDFVLPKAPVSNGLALFLNGVRMRIGASNDFTLSNKTITFVNAPISGDIILADLDY